MSVMKKNIISIWLINACFNIAAAQNTSCGVPIIAPVLSEKTRTEFEAKRQQAQQDFDKNPANADAHIWLGRRTAYLGLYEEAIRLYTEGVARHPLDARFYRHRGHRYLSIRCFDKGIADFETAAKLIKGKPDEIEPDGMPNAQNIPTSTLQSNIWYHLGLGYYLKGDYKKAEKAYKNCLKVSKNPDMYVATANWLYITLRQLNKNKEAAKLLATITADMKLIENEDYIHILRLYQGKILPESIKAELTKGTTTLSNASKGFGLGNFYLLNGQTAEAKEIFDMIVKGNQWSSFGYIAAEMKLKNM